MFQKLGAYLDLFRKGSEVSDPEKWKGRQVTATAVGGFLIALINLAKVYGYEVPISTDDVNSLGVGIIAVVNIVLTCTTSKRAGLLPAKPDTTRVQEEVQQPAPVIERSTPVQPEPEPTPEPTAEPAPEPTKEPAANDFSRDIYLG